PPRPGEHEAGEHEEEVDADVAEVRHRIDDVAEPVLQAVMADDEEREPEPQTGEGIQPGGARRRGRRRGGNHRRDRYDAARTSSGRSASSGYGIAAGRPVARRRVNSRCPGSSTRWCTAIAISRDRASATVARWRSAGTVGCPIGRSRLRTRSNTSWCTR